MDDSALLDPTERLRNDVNATVLCMGLDGATLDVVEPLAAVGYLPNLRDLMARGVWGRLRSSQPPLSPPAWASFATGVNPGVHGVFDFVTRSEDGAFRVSTGKSLRAQTIWDRLSAAGRKVGVLNVPLTYPPQPVNGFMISGLDAPRKSVATTYPDELGRQIEERFGTYWVERHTSSLLPVSARQFRRRYVAGTIEMTQRRGQVACWLLREYHPDVMIAVFIATDRLQHLDGCALAEITGRRSLDEMSLARNPVAAAYRAVDAEVGALIAAAGDRANVIVMSDHGFQPYERVFSLNTWLVKHGYLALDPSRLHPAAQSWIGRSLSRLRARQATAAGENGGLSRLFAAVDWSRTVAYSFGAFGSIYLNLSGKGPYGRLSRDRERGGALMAEIADRLASWRDPETGVAPIARVLPASCVYTGPMTEWGPDLLIETAPGYFIRNSLDSYPARIVEQVVEQVGQYGGRQLPHSAMHHPDGLLIMAGPAVRCRQGADSDGAGDGNHRSMAKITDLAPTLLYLVGEPVPSAMEGRILVDWLDEEYVRAHPLHPERRGEAFRANAAATDVLASDQRLSAGEVSPGNASPLPSAGAVYTAEEEEAVAAHLRGLGYL